MWGAPRFEEEDSDWEDNHKEDEEKVQLDAVQRRKLEAEVCNESNSVLCLV